MVHAGGGESVRGAAAGHGAELGHRGTVATDKAVPPVQRVTQGLENVGKTWYNSLQFIAEKRFSHGLTVVSSYALSKNNGAMGFLNDQDATPTAALMSYDRTHRWVFSGVYELPFGKGKPIGGGVGRGLNLLVGGWQYNWIATFQSGTPTGYAGGVDLIGNPKLDSRPSTVGSTPACSNSTAPAGSPTRREAGLSPAPIPCGRFVRLTRCAAFQHIRARCETTGLNNTTCQSTNRLCSPSATARSFASRPSTLSTRRYSAARTPTRNSPLYGYVTPSQSNFPRHVQLGFKFMW